MSPASARPFARRRPRRSISPAETRAGSCPAHRRHACPDRRRPAAQSKEVMT
ncbi:hypothetical protein [Lysobacter gummosus]|uniref:hypothetical protein n=1 Tax=Lysobacter gummosus TaxID=262324 RepID=UPI003631F7DE